MSVAIVAPAIFISRTFGTIQSHLSLHTWPCNLNVMGRNSKKRSKIRRKKQKHIHDKGEKLFQELRLVHPRACREDYYQNGQWRVDILQIDRELIEAHRKEARKCALKLSPRGSVARASKRQPTSAPPAPQGQLIYQRWCLNCGAEADQNHCFCPFCGYQLHMTRGEVKEEHGEDVFGSTCPPKKTYKRVICICIYNHNDILEYWHV